MTCCVCRHMHMRMYVAYGIGASRRRLRVAAVVHSSSSTRRAASARRCALGSMHAAARVHGRAACNPRRQPHLPVPRLQPCVPTDRCPLGAPYLTSISPRSPLYLPSISSISRHASPQIGALSEHVAPPPPCDSPRTLRRAHEEASARGLSTAPAPYADDARRGQLLAEWCARQGLSLIHI